MTTTFSFVWRPFHRHHTKLKVAGIGKDAWAWNFLREHG